LKLFTDNTSSRQYPAFYAHFPTPILMGIPILLLLADLMCFQLGY